MGLLSMLPLLAGNGMYLDNVNEEESVNRKSTLDRVRELDYAVVNLCH